MNSKTNLALNRERALFLADFEAGRFLTAKQRALKIARSYPQISQLWADLSVCSVKLMHWKDAVTYGKKCLSLTKAHEIAPLRTLDALSHASAALGDLESVRRFGLKALQLRDAEVLQKPRPNVVSDWLASKDNPANQQNQAHSSSQTTSNLIDRSQQAIVFSLFGGHSKYCETAILNVKEQQSLYPDWHCRFYIDSSVPEVIVNRLREAGALIFVVNEEQEKWPGPMWRFLACDDAHLERIVFRDADSVISKREASAVQEWIASQKAFHVMRDSGSHTELILAGLWGCVQSHLPPMQKMVSDFLQQPVSSAHFADQEFLRTYVWSLVRENMLEHDSLFGFMDGKAFPHGAFSQDFHVGQAEGAPIFSKQVSQKDGEWVQWFLCWRSDLYPEREPICSYSAQVKNGQIKAHLPARYILQLDKDYEIQVR